MLFTEIITVYSENHMKPINMLCGQNAELLNIPNKHIPICAKFLPYSHFTIYTVVCSWKTKHKWKTRD
jgi:hypothetical protein